MPQNAMLNSVIGNVQANRDRLSAIRQRVRLEPNPASQGTQMRQIAPSPPTGPAQVKGSAQQTVEEAMPNIVIPPEKEQSMLAQAKMFLDRYGQGQQAMIDLNKPKQQPQPSNAGQVVQDDMVKRGLSPLAEFFNANKRLPTAEELKQITLVKTLEARLGRQPTQTELELYLEKPSVK